MKILPPILVCGAIFSALAAMFAIVPLTRRVNPTIGPVPTNQPALLEVGGKDISGPAKVPCYVIPEALVVNTPQGIIVFVHEYHANELARKFPSRRLTNIIIYAR